MQGEIIREQLHKGGRVYGIHVCNLGGAHVMKRYSAMPLDFVFIDTEHTPLDRTETALMCQYYTAAGISPVVRIAYPNPYLASQAIDGGAQGIVVPYIETVDEAEAVVNAVYYRPLKGNVVESHRDKTQCLKKETVDYLSNYNKHNYLIIGIESVPAFEKLDDLIAVEGVDAIFIGPHDLSVSMEIPEQYSHPEFIRVVNEIIQKSRKKGLGAGMHLKPDNADFPQIKQYMEAGLNWILYSRDVDLMADKVSEVMHRLREL